MAYLFMEQIWAQTRRSNMSNVLDYCTSWCRLCACFIYWFIWRLYLVRYLVHCICFGLTVFLTLVGNCAYFVGGLFLKSSTIGIGFNGAENQLWTWLRCYYRGKELWQTFFGFHAINDKTLIRTTARIWK